MGLLKGLRKNSPAAQRLEGLGTMADVASVGLSFLFALVIGIGGGWWLDQKFGWGSKATLTGLVLGMAAGIRNVVVILRKYVK